MKDKRKIKTQRVIPCKGNPDGTFYMNIDIGEQRIYNMNAQECIELIQKIEEKL